MNKLLKVIGIVGVIGLLGLAYVWFFIYNKPHVDYEKAKPEYVLDAEDCYRHFVTGGTQELSYTGKILELSGNPTNIEDKDSLVVLVFVFDQGMFGDEGIRCTMLPKYNEQALPLKLDKTVRVKSI